MHKMEISVKLLLFMLCFTPTSYSGYWGPQSQILSFIKQVQNRAFPDYLQGLQIPNSPLMLFQNFGFGKVARKFFGRKRKDSTSPTTSTSKPDESSDSTPCTCSLGVCKCCTGYIMDLINQKACMRVTYHPGDFAFDVAMSFNDRILYENSMSGKNPRPICISPPRMPNLKVCAKFYNVFFPGRNFHFCLAMTGQWRAVELFNMAFDCLRMGSNGIAMVKPEDSGGLPIPNPLGGVDAVVDAGEDDIEEYDENLVRSLFNLFND